MVTCPFHKGGHENFNPRSRGGSDTKLSDEDKDVLNFNPRSRGGSDYEYPRHYSHTDNFNPRSRGGSDQHTLFIHALSVLFQSTLPRRERRCPG